MEIERERERRDWVDEEATDKEKRSETEATGCFGTMNDPDRGRSSRRPCSGILVCGPGHRDEALLKAEDRGRTHAHTGVYVGGRQTKAGKSASVFSDAEGQRAFWSWFVLVLPLSSRLQRKTEKGGTQHRRARWKRAEQNRTGESQVGLN